MASAMLCCAAWGGGGGASGQEHGFFHCMNEFRMEIQGSVDPPSHLLAPRVAGWVRVAYGAMLCPGRSESPCIHYLVSRHLLQMSRSCDQEL